METLIRMMDDKLLTRLRTEIREGRLEWRDGHLWSTRDEVEIVVVYPELGQLGDYEVNDEWLVSEGLWP